MSIKSTWMRWGVCSLVVLAMIAVLGGCSKKETPKTEEMSSTTETSEVAASPMVGSYMTPMANGSMTLMLNADNTAMMSLKPMENAPASVENGTWAAGAVENMVDVTFQKQAGDSTMSVTLNFRAAGDTLSLLNGEAVGFAGLNLLKQH